MEETVETVMAEKIVQWRYVITQDEEGSVVISEISRIVKEGEFVTYMDSVGDEYGDEGYMLANTLADAKEIAGMLAKLLNKEIVQVRYCSADGSEFPFFKVVK